MAKFDPRQNLQDPSLVNQISPEAMRERNRKAGIASGKAKREKKLMKELVLEILDMNIKAGKPEDFKNLADSKGKNISVGQATVLAQVKKAMNGDTRAMEFLRDTAGQKPVDKQEVKTEIAACDKLNEILTALTEDDEKKD